MTCMDFDHHHFCLSLNFLKFFFISALTFFFLQLFLLLFGFSFLLFLPVSRQLPPRKIAPRLGLRFGLSLELGLGEGAIFLWGNCPRTVLTVGKQGDFLHDNEMLDFIHLVYVESCTFLYILNESN